MNKFHLTTNIDLQNWSGRLDQLIPVMRPQAIEIFLLPQNYTWSFRADLPEVSEEEQFPKLNRQLAVAIGQRLKKEGINKIQIHYPWQFLLLEQASYALSQTIQFADIINQEAQAQWFSLNYHQIINSFDLNSPLIIEDRQKVLSLFDLQTSLAKNLKDQLNSPVQLLVENNPCSGTTEQFSQFDFIPEDYLTREDIDGTTLDIAHAWSVLFAAKSDQPPANLLWAKQFYGEKLQSTKSLEDFIKIVAPKIKWLHLADENTYLKDSGLHIGDGSIDFIEVAKLLDQYLPDEVPLTIEVSDGHKPDGFQKVLEQDYPKLKQIFK